MRQLSLLLLFILNYEINGRVDVEYRSGEVYSDWKVQQRKYWLQSMANRTPMKEGSSWLNLIGRRQEDPDLVKHIRKQLRYPTPSYSKLNDLPLNDIYILLNSTEFFNKDNGFFVEVEGKDGVGNSRTIPWEFRHNWSGLLIEANSTNYVKLMNSGRRIYTLNGGLCRSEWAEKMYFRSGYYHINPDNADVRNSLKMLCYPFFSVMAALNITTIDVAFISLNGWELDILQTIPFNDLDIRAFVVEYNTLENFQHLQSFMESHDYDTFCRLKNNAIFTKDKLVWNKAANETGYPQDKCQFIYQFEKH